MSDEDGLTSLREEAIRELLTLCAEKNVNVPVKMRAAILGKDIAEAMEKGPPQPKLAHAIEQRASELAALQEDELFMEIRKVYAGLKASPPELELRVVNGSYTVSNPVRDIDEALCKSDHDEETPNGSRAKQSIPTLKTESPVYKLGMTLKKIIRTRSLSLKPEIKEKVIAEGINLRLEPGKMYLVLGAPGCGKSTVLKMISNTLRQDDKHVVGGDIMINGVTPENKKVVWQTLTAYIDQIDRLHKYLTVKETNMFAFNCRAGGTHAEPHFDTSDPEVVKLLEKLDKEQFLVNSVLKGMGLARVSDTFVGDNVSVRGVSGGEKKRVTVAEMVTVRSPFLCCDEISTGLDAATTYDIVKLMGATGRLTNTTKVVSLLQPPPETVALFDALILLDSGRVIYFGPVDEVVQHFESLGYGLPERMDTADWLQALPTRDGAGYLLDQQQNHLSTEEFVEKYWESENGRKLMEALGEPMKEDTEMIETNFSTKYKNSSLQSLKLLINREMLLWWRDKVSIRARVMQDLIMGIVAGTLFWQQNDDAGSVVGIIFQAMFFAALGAMNRVPEQFDVRGVLYKHQDAKFFPTWTFVAGRSLAGVPTALIDSLLFGSLIFWFVGLAYNDGASIANYFIYLLIIFATSMCTGLMFSVFSATVTDKSAGQAAMSVCLVMFILFSGFAVQADIIPDYWIWVYWCNIFAWMLRSLIVNEFQSGAYDDEVSEGVTEGDAIMTQFGFTLNDEPFGFEWVWYGLGVAVAIAILSVFASVFFLQTLRFETGRSLATEMGDGGEDGDENEEPEEEITLPFQKVNLTFKDIHYTVTSSISDEKLELLKGIDGYIESGKMTALMGSSGAGKTTLMDVLSLRKTSGEVTGEVRLNGHLQEPLSFRRCTGYVEQFDVQSPQLTIRETVEFSAALRLEESDPAVTPESTAKFVDQTLAMLELTEVQDLQVGSDLTGGLSFEQNKRLAIAVELVSNPSVIFLDEPTSGLDARAASIVMRGLRRIADGGRAVCATIHQPSVAIFNSFDSLLLLKRGGETVFFGDLGDESSKLIEYLERYPSTPPIRPGENPATWMLTTIGAGSSSTGAKPFDYAGSFAASKLRKDALMQIEKFDESASDENLVSFPRKYATGRTTQESKVLSRTTLIYWRSPSYNGLRMVVSVVVALLFGSIYVSQRTPETESDMNSRVTTIFISFLFLAVNSFNTVLSLFEMERNMYYRHKANLMYDQSAILAAFTVAEIPFILLSSILFVVPFYFMLGFAAEADKFFLYYLFFTLNMGLFTFLGQMMVSVTKNSEAAQGFGGLIVGLNALFSGVLIRPQNITGFWVFAYWLLPGHYVMEALTTSQFNGDDTPITPSLGSDFEEFVLGTDECKELLEQDPTAVCTGTAEQWIEVSFGGEFDVDHLWYDFIYLLGAIVLSKVITYIALTKLNYLAK